LLFDNVTAATLDCRANPGDDPDPCLPGGLNVLFQGLWTDPVTGISYARNRWYDARTASWLSEDPMGAVDSPNLYAFVGWGPHVGRDPMGLTTEEQFAHLIGAALKRYLEEGNLTKLGEAGELVLERSLTRGGFTIVKGPGSLPGQHNADVIAYDAERGRFLFFDNKIQTGKDTISKAPNLSEPARKTRSIAVARANASKLLSKGEISSRAYDQMIAELDRLEIDHSRASWLISASAPEEVSNIAKRISVRLADKGVRYADVKDDRLDIKGAEESLGGVRGAGRFLKKVGKAAPLVGLGVSAVTGSARVEAAVNDDADYEMMMYLLNADPVFVDYSLHRELAVIAGEEATGEALAWAGGAVGLVCGPWCVAGGAIGGGLAGDALGGYLAGREFDRQHRVTEEELSLIIGALD